MNLVKNLLIKSLLEEWGPFFLPWFAVGALLVGVLLPFLVVVELGDFAREKYRQTATLEATKNRIEVLGLSRTCVIDMRETATYKSPFLAVVIIDANGKVHQFGTPGEVTCLDNGGHRIEPPTAPAPGSPPARPD